MDIKIRVIDFDVFCENGPEKTWTKNMCLENSDYKYISDTEMFLRFASNIATYFVHGDTILRMRVYMSRLAEASDEDLGLVQAIKKTKKKNV